MIYFDEGEVKALKEMIDYCDAYDGDSDYRIPRAYSEFLGAIRYKLDSERLNDEIKAKKSKGGVTE